MVSGNDRQATVKRARRGAALCAALTALSLGCSGLGCAGPRAEVSSGLARYGSALRAGDAQALRGLLTERAREALSPEAVRALLTANKAELEERAAALAGARIRVYAKLRTVDGEETLLDLEGDGAYRVASADALPAGARTPAQALEQLRRVLARRSYPALLRLLTPTLRSALEDDLAALVRGLHRPEALDIQVSGDRANVDLPGGHAVKLRRDAGVWRVDDLD